jgi:hypothetical protein
VIERDRRDPAVGLVAHHVVAQRTGGVCTLRRNRAAL